MRKLLFFAAVLMLSTAAHGASGVPEIVKKTIPGTKVDSVKKVGKYLYQVKAGKNIIYVTKDGYLIVGVVYKDGKNLSESALKESIKRSLKKLNISNAITVGNGTKEVIAFLDPECPYSREIWKEYLKPSLNNMKLHVFLFPLEFHKSARGKSCYVINSKNKLKALDEVMSGKGKLENCTEVDKMLAEGKRVGVSAVPSLFIKKGNYYEEIVGLNREKLNKNFSRDLFAIFNLEDALVVGSGKGKKVIVITDPYCPYCAKACNALRKYAENGKATFYVYFLPVHKGKSEIAIAYILSQPKEKQAETLAKIFERKIKDIKVKELTDEEKKRILNNVKQAFLSGFRSTPVFIFEDGKVIEGARIKEIEKEIEK